MEVIKSTATTKFDSSIELHVRLGIDTKQTDQNVRTSVKLPGGAGKKKIIAAFVSPANETAAKKAGADIVGSDELVAQIKKTEKITFDVAVAEPVVMKSLAPIAKILGTKGKMPSPKTGTVSADIAKAIAEIAGGRVEVKNDESGNVHLSIGKVSFDNARLKSNFETVIAALKSVRPKGAKQDYIKTVYLASTMGPSVKVQS